MKKIIYKMARLLIRLMLPVCSLVWIKITKKEAENGIFSVYNPQKFVREMDIQNLEMDETIDLSIIVPVYNAEKLLEDCLNSIVKQKTKYRFEVIVVNDGSTDKSLEIMQKYATVKIINKKNEGVAMARNLGLDDARGKYVAFIDSDDRIDENYVEKLLSRAYEKNADIVKCNFVEYSVANQSVIKYERHQSCSIVGNLGDKITEFKGFVWGGIFKRELWFDVRFLPQYWYEDMIVRFILFRKCKQFEYVNEDLYGYQNHASNISKSISRTENIRCLDHLFLVEELLEMSDELKLERDSALYKVLLQELGPILWLRTRDLKEQNRKYAFAMACDIIEKYKVECELRWNEKYLQKVFEKRSFVGWKLASIDAMLGVKMGNE